jgi:hypothetical protein
LFHNRPSRPALHLATPKDAFEAQLQRFGLCYEAAMVYAHHLSSSSRKQLIVPLGAMPLLPQAYEAEQLGHTLQRSKVGQDGATVSAVLSQVGDQVVCARCHIMPNTTVEPTQSDYVQAGRRPPLRRMEERVSVDGVLNTTLRVMPGRLEGPISMNLRTYEGSIPGVSLMF